MRKVVHDDGVASQGTRGRWEVRAWEIERGRKDHGERRWSSVGLLVTALGGREGSRGRWFRSALGLEALGGLGENGP